MQRAVWATYFYISSSNAHSLHSFCPKGPDTWCSCNKPRANGESYDHDEKKRTHLTGAVMLELKPIFKNLSQPSLLKKCVHGKEQNPNESLNTVIWKRIPKITFVHLKTLENGIYNAISTYNDGNIAYCRVLNRLGIDPKKNCIKAMKKFDMNRIRVSDYQVKFNSKEARSERISKR